MASYRGEQYKLRGTWHSTNRVHAENFHNIIIVINIIDCVCTYCIGAGNVHTFAICIFC